MGGSESVRGRRRSEKQGVTDEEKSEVGRRHSHVCPHIPGGHWAQQRGCHLWTWPSHEWAKPWSPSVNYSDGAWGWSEPHAGKTL